MTFRLAALAFAALAFMGPAACDQTHPAPPPTDITAAPALWKIADADTTVYFFGTVHVLPPDLQWHTAAIDKALGEAKAVYFETDIEPDRFAFMDIVNRLGMYDPADRLSDHLTPEQAAKLKTVADRLQIPMVLLETRRPWYAAITMSDAVIRGAGYDPDSGVERTFLPVLQKQGKEIRKLETIEQQMLAFATLPEKVQIDFLIDGLDEIDTAHETLGEMVNTWKKGDTKSLQHLLIDDDLAKNAEIYEALLNQRNANWAPVIDTLMKSETGTFFVAVGTAHLIGKDSVLEKLKPLGYTAERIE